MLRRRQITVRVGVTLLAAMVMVGGLYLVGVIRLPRPAFHNRYMHLTEAPNPFPHWMKEPPDFDSLDRFLFSDYDRNVHVLIVNPEDPTLGMRKSFGIRVLGKYAELHSDKVVVPISPTVRDVLVTVSRRGEVTWHPLSHDVGLLVEARIHGSRHDDLVAVLKEILAGDESVQAALSDFANDDRAVP